MFEMKNQQPAAEVPRPLEGAILTPPALLLIADLGHANLRSCKCKYLKPKLNPSNLG